MEFVISWIDEQSNPISTVVTADQVENTLILEDSLNIEQDQSVWIYPVRDLHEFSEYFENLTYKGQVNGLAPIEISLLDIPEPSDTPLMSLIQRKIPQGNEYISEYNTRLSSTILESLELAEIITTVGGVTHSTQIRIEHRADTLMTQLQEDSITSRHINYSSMAILKTEYGDKTIQIEVYLREVSSDDNLRWMEIIPLKLYYGKGSSLETHYFDQTISTTKIVSDKINNSIRFWFRALRAPQYFITFLSILVGIFAVRIKSFPVNIFDVILIVIGTFAIQAGGNLLNDYFDHTSELDEITIVPSVSPTSNKFIQNKLIHPITDLTMGYVLFSIGAVIGLYLNFVAKGQVIFMLGIAGAITTYFYTGEPLKLAYRGIGEILLALNFGPFIIMGTYYVLSDDLLSNQQLITFTLPPLLFIIGLLMVNEIDDIEADKLVGKWTTAVRLGRENTLLLVFFLLFLAINITIYVLSVTIIDVLLLILVFVIGLISLVPSYQFKEKSPKLEVFAVSYLIWCIVIFLQLI